MKIGILGGIGPLSSAQLYIDVIKGLQVSGYIASNQDYPQIIINSIPAPPLTSLHCQQAMLLTYIKGIQELNFHRPHFIVLACNTIHLFVDTLRAVCAGTPIISLRDLVYQALLSKPAQKICVLATPMTVRSGLYLFKNFDYYQAPTKMLLKIGEMIDHYSNTGDFKIAKIRLWGQVQELQDLGVDYFILGCTEISLLLRNTDIQYLDTMAILCDYLVQRAVRYLKLKTQLCLHFDLPSKLKST